MYFEKTLRKNIIQLPFTFSRIVTILNIKFYYEQSKLKYPMYELFKISYDIKSRYFFNVKSSLYIYI